MMILIFITLIAMLAMARKPYRRPKRRMGRYIRGNVDERLDLGTLAGATLVAVAFDDAVTERMLISSLVATWSLSDVTPVENCGPVIVGVAHSDYTAAEIEAVIEAVNSWDEGDLITREIMQRKVRIVGTFRDRGVPLEQIVLNDGRPVKTKLNWILTTGDTLDVFAYNLGTAAFATTDPQIHVSGHVNLWPRG